MKTTSKVRGTKKIKLTRRRNELQKQLLNLKKRWGSDHPRVIEMIETIKSVKLKRSNLKLKKIS